MGVLVLPCLPVRQNIFLLAASDRIRPIQNSHYPPSLADQNRIPCPRHVIRQTCQFDFRLKYPHFLYLTHYLYSCLKRKANKTYLLSKFRLLPQDLNLKFSNLI